MNKALVLGTLIAAAASSASALTLTGAGASFPYPLYSKYFDVYKTSTGVEVNYQSIGSGGGKRQILAQTVDFGATDGPMTNEELATAPDKNKILHIPTALGAVVVAYNVPGVDKLNFSGQVLADIFLGDLNKWNDPALVKLNPGVNLPALPITVAHRSDSSGTSYIFTDYLTKVSPEWAKKVGRNGAPTWPTGLGGKGNEGVTGIVKQTPGAIGYTELIYAVNNKIDFGNVQNKAGKFIVPSNKTVTAAAAGGELPADTRVSITNTAAASGYPISGYTWLLVYKNQSYNNRSMEQAKALKNMLSWVITTGQKYNDGLGYSKIPQIAVSRAKALIGSMTFNGQKL